MNIQEEIKVFIATLSEPKQQDLRFLNEFIIQQHPVCKLWFFNGKDEQNKIVANPTIGYGELTLKYAKGGTANSFQIGLSANKAGISIYLMGMKDKSYLKENFSNSIGKATLTGYCLKFKAVKDLNFPVLQQILEYGFSERNEPSS